MSRFWQTYDDIAFELLLYGSTILISLILLYSLVFNRGGRGTYGNYGSLIWDLFKAPAVSSSSRRGVTTTSNSSKGEAECKRVMESIFAGRKFNKYRPSFLHNDVTGSNLELDCFNPELKLAVEYNGRQHYAYSPYFHATKHEFYNLRYRDEIKRRLCREKGIHLIIVPYTIQVDKIESYIKNKLHHKNEQS